MDGSMSWTGKTLALHGTDMSAIGHNAYGTAVWKSSGEPAIGCVGFGRIIASETEGPSLSVNLV